MEQKKNSMVAKFKIRKQIILSFTAFIMAANTGIPYAHAVKSRNETINSTNTNLGLQGAQPWDYNPGPDPMTAEGRAFIDLYSEMPEYSVMSDMLMDQQKFRYTFGTMLTRTRFEKNSVKIFFIGQDATHIAEASKQPGTSGFGGRVQAIANYFGVDQSVATTNAYSSTIKGQYAQKGHPMVELDASGNPQITFENLVDNGFWALSNDPDSKVRQDREAFFEHMIQHNPESLKMMVLFGGAAKDAFAEFLIARGAEVPTFVNPDQLKNMSRPSTMIVSAGGNNTFPVLVNAQGKDIYQILLRDNPKYSSFLDKRGNLDYANLDVQKAVTQVLKDKKQEALKLMVFEGGGMNDSGIMHAGQLGYNLKKVKINGVETNSLRGLRLKNGYVVKDDLLFAESAHPTALTMMAQEKGKAAAEDALAKSFEPLKKWAAKGWFIKPDMGTDGKIMENSFAAGKRPDWGRGEVGSSYFEFGAPSDRRANSASATRDGSQVILAGATDKKFFDKTTVDQAKLGIPSEVMNPEDLFTIRQRSPETRYVFDRGPGKTRAKLLYTSIDQSKLFAVKPGMESVDSKGRDATFAKNGIDAYYAKTDAQTGLFGFHRGSFDTSEALILADPHGMDDWNTARAMTGARGQYLNRMMSDLGIPENYLVIKTVPVGMDGASAEDWEYVRKNTEKYREVAIAEALKSGKVKYLFADGEIAAKEMQRVLRKMNVTTLQVVNIARDGMDARSGIIEARAEAQARFGLAEGQSFQQPLQMKDIPRAHLTWWSRIWEGTGGDHVIEAVGKMRGHARALIAPNWVPRQEIRARGGTLDSIKKIMEKFDFLSLRKGKEKIAAFLERKGLKGSLSDKLVKNAKALPENIRSLTPGIRPSAAVTCEGVFMSASGQ